MDTFTQILIVAIIGLLLWNWAQSRRINQVTQALNTKIDNRERFLEGLIMSNAESIGKLREGVGRHHEKLLQLASQLGYIWQPSCTTLVLAHWEKKKRRKNHG